MKAAVRKILSVIAVSGFLSASGAFAQPTVKLNSSATQAANVHNVKGFKEPGQLAKRVEKDSKGMKSKLVKIKQLKGKSSSN